ncbi:MULTISPECIES: hypothetical protein [Paraburkholderia]|uniref:Uncharacterized protein n=1 Tax=Paraburkholderia madseniana TaxID=2599607 RepID=A0AAP5BFH0_9BURK|nr:MULTISPECIES: hypothetical protein [Paraburkholderia]MCX4147154.1 hypothetical protein [Paraburkholderia madseniana]MDN7150097.1 hypothetical protein [Paraburkholderia sp. WS6]MDQ6408977.1 hypothetical protein [Paraburkholderia madseniana]
MPDDRLRVAVRHVSAIRECPDGFRGFTLDDVCVCKLLKGFLPLILKGIQNFLASEPVCRIVKSHFTMQMFLRRTRAPHIIDPIGCSSSATSAVSSTSSFGGLNPNRSFGFFFAHGFDLANAGFGANGKGKWPFPGAGSPDFSPKPPQALTPRDKFLYNSELFRIRARGGRTRESLHAPRCAHYKQEKIHWAQQFFWIDHEDVFRKSP